MMVSCELSEPVFENPLDREVAFNKGIEPPALVFYPDVITTNTTGVMECVVEGMVLVSQAVTRHG